MLGLSGTPPLQGLSTLALLALHCQWNSFLILTCLFLSGIIIKLLFFLSVSQLENKNSDSFSSAGCWKGGAKVCQVHTKAWLGNSSVSTLRRGKFTALALPLHPFCVALSVFRGCRQCARVCLVQAWGQKEEILHARMSVQSWAVGRASWEVSLARKKRPYCEHLWCSSHCTRQRKPRRGRQEKKDKFSSVNPYSSLKILLGLHIIILSLFVCFCCFLFLRKRI